MWSCSSTGYVHSTQTQQNRLGAGQWGEGRPYGVNTGNRDCLSGWKVGIGSVPSFKAEC